MFWSVLLLTTLVAQITVSTRLFIQFVFSTNMALLRITCLLISEKIHANMSLLNFLVRNMSYFYWKVQKNFYFLALQVAISGHGTKFVSWAFKYNIEKSDHMLISDHTFIDFG